MVTHCSLEDGVRRYPGYALLFGGRGQALPWLVVTHDGVRRYPGYWLHMTGSDATLVSGYIVVWMTGSGATLVSGYT